VPCEALSAINTRLPEQDICIALARGSRQHQISH
jgi:hypothetical protein